MSNSKRGRPTNEARKKQGLIPIQVPNNKDRIQQVISESQREDRERKNNNTFNCRIKKCFEDRQMFDEIESLLETLKFLIPFTIDSSLHHVFNKSSRNLSNLSKNEKAEDFRKRKILEWNQLLDYRIWMEDVLHNYETSGYNNEVILKLQSASEHFDKYTCCEHCLFVFRKDGLTQHTNVCKIKIRMELKNFNGSNESEKSNEIYRAHKSVFNNIKEQNLTIQCLLEYLNHENGDFNTYDSLVKDFKTQSFEKVPPFDDMKRKRVSSENEPENKMSFTIEQNDILFYNVNSSIGNSSNETSDEFECTNITYLIQGIDIPAPKVSIQSTETNALISSSPTQSNRCFFDNDLNLETTTEEQYSNIQMKTKTGNIQNIFKDDILNIAFEMTKKDIEVHNLQNSNQRFHFPRF